MKVNLETFSSHFVLKEITTGVYAAIAIDGKGAVGNAGIVNLGNSTLVFDTFNTQQAAEDLKTAAEKLTGHHVQYVINSHWHGDHIRGNQVFDSSIIISSTKTYDLMKAIHPDRIQRQQTMLPNIDEELASLKKKMEKETDNKIVHQLLLQISFLNEFGLSLPNLKLTLPNLTFESSLTLHGTSRKVQIISLGAAHTNCDSILFLQDEQIAFTADIVSIENHPLLKDGNPRNWINVLDKMAEMDIKTVIPGHGPVCGGSALQDIKKYIQDLTYRIEQFIKQGYTVDMIDKVEAPDYCREWHAESVFYQNLRYLYELYSEN